MAKAFIEGGVCAPKGFVAGGLHCGIRKNQAKKDLAMIFAETECAAAAVYTQNKVYGAPITVTRAHLENGKARAVVCNSGNANTCNADGVEKANAMCELTARALGICADDVIVASTGVIGQTLDIEPIVKCAPTLAASLSASGAGDAAQAIMTTDVLCKEVAVEFDLNGVLARVGAMAKGSGMIHPNMATMLGFMTTDAAVTGEMLSKALKAVVADTFNMISIDGDTSTNDMVCILASGMAQNDLIDAPGVAYDALEEAIRAVATRLSRLIASDGEGATKLLTCQVEGASDKQAAKTVAKSVIMSSLVKAAMFGEDANWGRVLCAIGYAPVDFDINRVAVWLESAAGSAQVCAKGVGVPFSEAVAKRILGEKEIVIKISLGDGPSNATAWGCDLTYDYVKINGDYRT